MPRKDSRIAVLIAISGVVLACLSLIAMFVVPEVRGFFGLGKESAPSSSPSNEPMRGSDPLPSKMPNNVERLIQAAERDGSRILANPNSTRFIRENNESLQIGSVRNDEIVWKTYKISQRVTENGRFIVQPFLEPGAVRPTEIYLRNMEWITNSTTRTRIDGASAIGDYHLSDGDGYYDLHLDEHGYLTSVTKQANRG